MTQHTLGHVDCAACEETKRAIMYSANFAQYKFREAATLWLESRKKLSRNTHWHYSNYIKNLDQFFDGMTLSAIHIGNLAAYQAFRQAQIRTSKQHAARKRGAAEDNSDGASLINHEISCILRQVLKHAALWAPIEKHYEPLPLPKDSVGMALTEEEEQHLYHVGRAKPRWLIAYCCDMLSRNTTAGPGEIRHLRMKNIDLDKGVIHIEEGVKNEFRIRPVPINDDARWALEQLIKRYHAACRKAGVHAHPEHYLLYHRAPGGSDLPDFSRPMSSWKRAHYAMRAEAGKAFPRLLQLRRYDLRHTACTDLLENPAIAYATIEHMMGHRLSSRTKRRYDHLRDSRLKSAAEALNHGFTRKKDVQPMDPTPMTNAAMIGA